MKESVKSKIAPKWLRYSGYSISAITLIAVLIYILTDNQNWLFVIALTLPGPMLAFSFLLALLQNKKPKFTHVCFSDTGASVCLGKAVLKRIPYEKVAGATILRAMSYPYLGSYWDSECKERGVLTLYQSNCSFLHGLNSKAGIVCHGYNMNALCYDLSYAEHLSILLEKTAACIYVTEQMLALHKELLMPTLQVSPDRFFVAYLDKSSQKEKIIPYNEYIFSCQE